MLMRIAAVLGKCPAAGLCFWNSNFKTQLVEQRNGSGERLLVKVITNAAGKQANRTLAILRLVGILPLLRLGDPGQDRFFTLQPQSFKQVGLSSQTGEAEPLIAPEPTGELLAFRFIDECLFKPSRHASTCALCGLSMWTQQLFSSIKDRTETNLRGAGRFTAPAIQAVVYMLDDCLIGANCATRQTLYYGYTASGRLIFDLIGLVGWAIGRAHAAHHTLISISNELL